ncbi:ABC transporter ATP-binding protein [Acuticoccus sp.]|uniref:ABC transporter ATP-binding protein n=1 Tax=Acuticoccus sp. TaxID=1904378 RepID=UPI003B52D211
MSVHSPPRAVPREAAAPASGGRPAAARPVQRPSGVSLDVEGVSHSFGAFRALDDVTLNVDPGEIVALLGPSGCGKSTLLRVVAGFLQQSAGSVSVDGTRVDRTAPGARNVGIVFQNYALFPHMSVAQNVGYGLSARGRPRREVREAVARFLDVVRMEGFADRRPRQLSGGQQQRVALARALAIEPGILLLDEPFAALDKNLRLDMQIEIKRLQRQFGLTAILVTHDQEEAMSIADRVAVMDRGRIEQLGTAVAVYDRPASLFVNGFIGSSNLFPGAVRMVDGDNALVELDAGTRVLAPNPARIGVGERAVLSFRPEALALYDEADPSRVPVRCRMSLPLGGLMVLDLETEGGQTIKLTRMRDGPPPTADALAYCGAAPGARPSLFPMPADGAVP